MRRVKFAWPKLFQFGSWMNLLLAYLAYLLFIWLLIYTLEIPNMIFFSQTSNIRINSDDTVFICSILRKNPQIWEQWTVKCLWYQFMIPKGWIVFYILCLKVYYSFVSYQNPKGQERVRLIWVGNIWHISCLRKICLFS